MEFVHYSGDRWALTAGDFVARQLRILLAGGGPKGPPSAPPAIPPIIINPFTYSTPAPAIDPRIPPPGPPLQPPAPPRQRFA